MVGTDLYCKCCFADGRAQSPRSRCREPGSRFAKPSSIKKPLDLSRTVYGRDVPPFFRKGVEGVGRWRAKRRLPFGFGTPETKMTGVLILDRQTDVSRLGTTKVNQR